MTETSLLSRGIRIFVVQTKQPAIFSLVGTRATRRRSPRVLMQHRQQARHRVVSVARRDSVRPRQERPPAQRIVAEAKRPRQRVRQPVRKPGDIHDK